MCPPYKEKDTTIPRPSSTGALRAVGNSNEHTFEEIWTSPRAAEVRQMARNCGRNCWMIGSVAPEIKKRKLEIGKWVLKNKGRY